MNVQNVKQKLDKVNNFYAYLIENQSIVSRVDRDAFLASIRALYDACFEEAVEEAPAVPTPTPTPPVQEPQPTTEPAKKKPKLVFNTPNTNTPTPEPTPDPSPEPEPEPVAPVVVAPVPPPATEQPPAIATPPTPIEKPVEPTPEPPVPVSTPVNTAAAAEEESGFNEAYETLFHYQEATDLSQKLSSSKLDDLQKALGLNEKFLYINELFGGDVGQFQTAIKMLNDGKDFAGARQYMEQNLIEQNEWMHKTKRPIAKDFIKLIRRRYA
jgi:hypothetical protein